MDYKFTPTTVFTPIEYGCIGFSEEDAIKKYGADNIEAYVGNFKPLDWNYSKTHDEDRGYAKLVVNSADSNRVVGFHYVGPQAGEVT